ncbi:uncharacterized protein LOC109010958, partial [Juglans regia]|uniref:Uncharacterized protein LOC109010958 n=2 Tax=Juglans regia TaxID=51240 RepID=A0A2I4GUA6_JUGRE
NYSFRTNYNRLKKVKKQRNLAFLESLSLLLHCPSSDYRHLTTEPLHQRRDSPFLSTTFGLRAVIVESRHRPANVLESFSVGTRKAHSDQTLTPGEGDLGFTGVAGESNANLNGSPGDDDLCSISGARERYEGLKVALGDDAGVHNQGYEFWTESIDGRLDHGDPTLVQSLWTVRSRAGLSSRRTVSKENLRSAKTSSKDFPPMLPLLDEDGRPMFNLVKVRSGGRLLIVAKRNMQPRFVRTHSQDGRLRIDIAFPQESEDEEGEEEKEEGKEENVGPNNVGTGAQDGGPRIDIMLPQEEEEEEGEKRKKG